MIQYKRQTPIKAQDGIALRSDNTFVSRPLIQERIPVAPGYGTEWTYVDTSKLPSTQLESNVAAGAIRLTRPLLRPIILSIAAYSPAIGSFLGEKSFLAPSDWSLVPGTSTIYKVPIREGVYIPGSVSGSVPRSRDLAENASDTVTLTRTLEAARDTIPPSSGTTPPNDENNNGQEKSWKEILSDVKGKFKRNKSKSGELGRSQTPDTPKDPSRGGPIRTARKALWETKGNHWGGAWQWRNAGRALGYGFGLSELGDGNIGRGVGIVTREAGKTIGENVGGFKSALREGYNKEVKNNTLLSDSTNTRNTVQSPPLTPAQSRSAQTIADSLEDAAILRTKALFDSILK